MKIRSIEKVIILLITLIVFSQCAKMVAPTGGPKDEQHPLIVKINPPDETINFDSKKISITFDEFIQLKDLNTNLVISPPLEEKPDIRVKGKILIIEFGQELKDSTTYNIYFGNSVQDYNEGNPIENFQYVLSTGSYIDSLTISGQIINSFNLIPEEGVYVMLYTDYEDSVPAKQVPVHISKTNKEGFFRINNISNNKFKLFCLRDFNKNYLFDLPNEDIAFIDSLVEFHLITETTIDTLYKTDSTGLFLNDMDDTTNIESTSLRINTFNEHLNDTIKDSRKLKKDSLEKVIDTIIINTKSYYPDQNFIFRLFTEYHEVQYLANNSRNIKQKIDVVFNKPIKDSVIFSLVDTVINNDWYLKESSINNDSITYWLTEPELFSRENLTFAITYQKEDSNLIYQWNTDTVKFRYFEVKEKKRKNVVVDTSLKYTLNVKQRGTFDLNKKIVFQFETPVFEYDTSKIKMFALVDTLEIPVKFDLRNDRVNFRKYNLSVDWCEDTTYRLDIYPFAFKDIYQVPNDTNIVQFKTQKRDYYGKILADMTGIDSTEQIICQLILPAKDKEVVYDEKIIDKNQIVEFSFLPPKEFLFKVIIDKNYNKKWDTGNYYEHIQPEEVLYYDEKIKVRSNWDIEINFDVKK